MTKIIHNFSIYAWLAALMAVSFSGSAFGFFGIVGSLGALIIVGGVGFFSLSMGHNKRHQKDALKQVSDGVALAGMVLFLTAILSVGLIEGLIVLLLFLHVALNLTFREHRQTGFGLLINFIVLMTGAINTFSSGYLFFMLAFCVCVCFYMALLFVDKQRHALPAETNTFSSIPEQARSVLNLNSSHNAQQQRDIHYVGEWRSFDKLMMAVMISLVAGTIYLITPHFSAGNLGRMPIEGFGKYNNVDLEEQILPEGSGIESHFYKKSDEDNTQGSEDGQNGGGNQEQTQKQGGNIPTFDPNASFLFNDPQEQLDNSILYYVKSEQPRYMQTDTATYFDGSSWQRLQYGWRKLANEYDDFTLYPEEPNASIGITVVKEISSSHLLTTDNTVGIRFPSDWVATDYYDQLKTGSPLTVDTSYELMLVDEFNDNTGRLIDRNQADVDNKDLQLPTNLDPRIKTLADKLLANATTDIDKANILEQHLRTNYEYTLDTIANQNNIPLADFLFGSQRGHCEYFATAMAVMLRQQGIPARMITGYVAQDYNPMTGFYEVKGTNGHAWVQAYVDGSWTLYEATGAYNTPQQDATEHAQEQTRNTNEIIKDYLEKVNAQDELLRETQDLTLWQQIQLILRGFWYQIVLVFTVIVTFLKTVLPWLLGVAVLIGSLGWLIWQKWQSKALERADKNGYKELLSLDEKFRNSEKSNDEEALKVYIHQYLSVYQGLLARHRLPRPIGQQVEDFVQTLMTNNLCSAEQASMLIELTNTNFYLTDDNNLTEADIHNLFIQLYEQAMARFSK